MVFFTFRLFPEKIDQKAFVNFLFSKTHKERFIIQKMNGVKDISNNVWVNCSLTSRVEKFKVTRHCFLDLYVLHLELEQVLREKQCLFNICGRMFIEYEGHFVIYQQPLQNIFKTDFLQTLFNDTHRENCVLLNSVQELIKLEAWFLLKFSLSTQSINFCTFHWHILKSTDV